MSTAQLHVLLRHRHWSKLPLRPLCRLSRLCRLQRSSRVLPRCVLAALRQRAALCTLNVHVHAIQKTISHFVSGSVLEGGNSELPASAKSSNAVVNDGVVKADFSKL